MSLASRINDLATGIGNYIRDSVAPRLLPIGGTAGQVLAKNTANPYDVSWVDPGGGGGLSSLSRTIIAFNVPTDSWSHTETVPMANVNPGDYIFCSIVDTGYLGENPPDWLNLNAVGAAVTAVDQVTVTMSFGEPTTGEVLVYLMAVPSPPF